MLSWQQLRLHHAACGADWGLEDMKPLFLTIALTAFAAIPALADFASDTDGIVTGGKKSTPEKVAACVVNVRLDDTLNVRSGPGVRFRILYAIPPTACGVSVQWGSCQGNWCRVTHNGRTGWANTRFIG